jgi:hypothetical protein
MLLIVCVDTFSTIEPIDIADCDAFFAGVCVEAELLFLHYSVY